MQHCSFVIVLTIALPAFGYGQATATASAPIATSGLNLGVVNGTFRYGATASESFQTGYGQNQNLSEQTNISGSLIYATKSLKTPFNAIYTGGVLFSTQRNYGTNTFQSLALSQGYIAKGWSLGLSDAVSYLPQSPTVGLSGIPGTGDMGLSPVVGGDTPAQNILTYNSNRISNTASATASRSLTARTALTGVVSYGILHYFDNDSLNTKQISGDLGVNHEIDPRTSVGVDASYSIFTFGNYLVVPQSQAGGDASFTTRALSVRGQRQFTRALSGSLSVGPQWVNSSSKLGIPSRLGVYVNGNATYVRRFGTFLASYSRGANGGSGVLPGAFSDSIVGSASRAYGHNWAVSGNVGFTRTSGLGASLNSNLIVLPGVGSYGNFDSTFAGAQVTRRISDSFSGFASYTASNQTYGNVRSLPGAISGLVQSFSIGVSWYPKSTNLGQF
jgi:hypothetical protein